MSETTLKRLKDLREVVQRFENAPTVSFDEESDVHFDMQFFYREADCGTVACALGAYALSEYGQSYFFFEQEPGDEVLAMPRARYFKFSDPYTDAAKHFGIKEHESEWLFDPWEYEQIKVTPRRVVKRIDHLIERYGG